MRNLATLSKLRRFFERCCSIRLGNTDNCLTCTRIFVRYSIQDNNIACLSIKDLSVTEVGRRLLERSCPHVQPQQQQ